MTVCVCVPARNEAVRLPVLIDALAAQSIGGRIMVALCINNSDDGSEAVARALADRHAERLDLRIDACTLPSAMAHAGSARARAMAAGYAALHGDGVLISTDADCRPPADWIAASLAAIEVRADVVGGRIVLDADEPTDPAISAMRSRFDAYWAAVRDIEDAIDPSPCDPPPRHGDHTGASLAIRSGVYRAAGGVPAIASGEDRALVIAALSAGARLSHPAAVWTRVSARTKGRASGGMAGEMVRMADMIASRAQPRVAAFEHWRQRAEWRRATRARVGVSAMLTQEERLPKMPADMELPA